jgi:type IV pilus assembly protein PilW
MFLHANFSMMSMSKNWLDLADRRNQSGVTIIELMVSIAIGMVLIAAMLALFSGLSGGNRSSEAQAQMNEDAQYALRLLSNQIRQSSYNPIQPGRTTLNPLPFGIFACDNGFANAIGPTAAASVDSLTCNAAASTTGGAIALAYEADKYNTVETASTPKKPTDCLGYGINSTTYIDPVTLLSNIYYVAENRFYVSGTKLYCAGSGGTTLRFDPQPMVENVERIAFSYGVSDPTPIPAASAPYRTVAGYLTSDDIGPSNGAVLPNNTQLATQVATPALRWAKVVSIRICVTMRSVTQVLDQPQSYYGCNPEVDASPILATDRYLRKNYTMTVALRNRVELP